MHFQLAKYWSNYWYVYKRCSIGIHNCNSKIWFDSIDQYMSYMYKDMNINWISNKREVNWKLFEGMLSHWSVIFLFFVTVLTFSTLIGFRFVSKATHNPPWTHVSVLLYLSYAPSTFVVKVQIQWISLRCDFI